MSTDLPAVPDEVFVAAVREAVSLANRDSHDYNLMFLEGGIQIDLFRAALAVAYAAGRDAADDGGKAQWGVRRLGFKSVRITDERTARSLLRHWVVPGELVKRYVGPWLPVGTNAEAE